MLAKQIVEQRHREVWNEASSRGQKKATPEQEVAMKEVRRMAAACEALAGFASLDDSDVAAGPGRALGDAAMAMLTDAEVKDVALVDLANMATRSDRPAVWRFCEDHGFIPSEPDSIFVSEGRWARSTSRPMAWIGKALQAESWNMAKMLAASPAGKVGVPTPRPKPAMDQDTPRLAAGEAKPAKAKAKKSRARASFDSPAALHWQAMQDADYWIMNDPTLIEWQRHFDDAKGFPAAVKKALADHGFVPSFGEPAFDIAAAELATRGCAPALAACVKAGVSPLLALSDADFESEGMAWNGRYPDLALEGGVMRGKDELASWTPIASWIDAHLGAGFSEKLCSRAALSVLREWSRDKYSSYGSNKGHVATAIAWLTDHGPQDAGRAAEELGELQGMALDLAEIDRGKPRAEQAALAALMHRWSVAATGTEPKPRATLRV